jgi:hypothetical protein
VDAVDGRLLHGVRVCVLSVGFKENRVVGVLLDLLWVGT